MKIFGFDLEIDYNEEDGITLTSKGAISQKAIKLAKKAMNDGFQRLIGYEEEDRRTPTLILPSTNPPKLLPRQQQKRPRQSKYCKK